MLYVIRITDPMFARDQYVSSHGGTEDVRAAGRYELGDAERIAANLAGINRPARSFVPTPAPYVSTLELQAGDVIDRKGSGWHAGIEDVFPRFVRVASVAANGMVGMTGRPLYDVTYTSGRGNSGADTSMWKLAWVAL